MVQNTLEPIPNVLLSAAKRNVLLAKICAFCVGLSILHIVVDASQGLYDSVAVDFGFGLVIGIAFLLNRWHYHRTSKIFVLLLLNAMFILFTSVLPKDVGIYLYYFPLIVVSSALFGSEEQGFRYFFLFLPVMMLCILVNYDFDLLPGVQLKTPLNVDAFFCDQYFLQRGSDHHVREFHAATKQHFRTRAKGACRGDQRKKCAPGKNQCRA